MIRIDRINHRSVRIAAVWGIILATGFRCTAEDEEHLPSLEPDQLQVEVRTVPLRQGRLPLVWKALATVELPADVSGRVVARSSGIVRSVSVREGESVTSGTVLMQLDDRAAHAQLAGARAALEVARHDLDRGLHGGLDTDLADLQLAADQAGATAEQARREVERLTALHARELVSDKQLEEAVQAAASARGAAEQAHAKAERYRQAGRDVDVLKLEAAVSQADAGLIQAGLDFEATKVRTSTPAVVDRLLVRPGDRIDAGAVLVECTPDGARRLTMLFSPAEADQLAPDDVVESLAPDEWPLKAHISAVTGAISIESGLVQVAAQIDETSVPLRSGQVIPVAVWHGLTPETVIIPASAISYDEEQPVVALVTEGLRGRIIPVEILARYRDEVAVKKANPLMSGKVIVEGNENLPDGARVIEKTEP